MSFYIVRYEELSAKYDGLLKILELRHSDIKRSHDENEKLIEEMQSLKTRLSKYGKKISFLMKKLKDIRTKKKMKVNSIVILITIKNLLNSSKIYSAFLELFFSELDKMSKSKKDITRYQWY